MAIRDNYNVSNFAIGFPLQWNFLYQSLVVFPNRLWFTTQLPPPSPLPPPPSLTPSETADQKFYGADDQKKRQEVWRRYSEFEALRNFLVAIYPQIVVPPLPEKAVRAIQYTTVRVSFRRGGRGESFLPAPTPHNKYTYVCMYMYM